MAIDNNPRSLTREELFKLFKTQRAVRAFEELFRLVPDELIDLKLEVGSASGRAQEAVDLLAAIELELNDSRSVANEALDALQSIAESLELLSQAPHDELGTIAAHPEDLLNVKKFQRLLGDNLTNAHRISEGSDDYLNINTTNGSEEVSWGNTSIEISFSWQIGDNKATSFHVQQGANDYILISTSNGSEAISFGNTTTNPDFNLLGSGTLTMLNAAISMTNGDITLTNGDITLTNGDLSAANVSGAITDTSANLIASSATLTHGAGAAAGTLANAPAAGDPTKWVAIDDNGVTRYVPAW